MKKLILCSVIFVFSLIYQTHAGDLCMPPDSGLINVRDYGAKGDGVTDDTAAIQQAISQNIAVMREINDLAERTGAKITGKYSFHRSSRPQRHRVCRLLTGVDLAEHERV